MINKNSKDNKIKHFVRKLISEHNTIQISLPVELAKLGYESGNYVTIKRNEVDNSLIIKKLDLD